MGLLERMRTTQPQTGATGTEEPAPRVVPRRDPDPRQDLKRLIHEKLIDEMGSSQDPADTGDEKLKQAIRNAIDSVLDERNLIFSRKERDEVVAEVSDEVLGLGPIEPLLKDQTVTEVMVNGPHHIYIERSGRIELTDRRFVDDDHVMRIIDKIVSPIGRRIDESSPMVDARLKDGSRVNAIIPPLSLKGPTLTIRKFSRDPYKVHDLLRFGTLSEEMAQFMEAAVRSRLNIVVSGGTGSGKTTTLNVLSSFIPSDERIVTIEDAAEIQLQQEHVVTLESRQPNIEGKGAVAIRDLVRNSLRMRPDRIVVGEVRGGEALDMLQAMNTGHDGSLTTAHANTPRDALARLETMVLMAGMELPVRAIREQISGAVDLIFQQERLKDGKRRITAITEVVGMEGDTITLQDIFVYERSGVDADGRVLGKFTATGIVPKCAEKFKIFGVKLPMNIFYADERR